MPVAVLVWSMLEVGASKLSEAIRKSRNRVATVNSARPTTPNPNDPV